MLVLSGKANEDIFITVDGVTIRIIILSIIGSKIRLGFEAPKEASILRGDLYRDANRTHKDK